MNTKIITFDQLVIIEPDLFTLYLKARKYPVTEKYCPINTWYREFKPVMIRLVGWFAKVDDETLKSHQAYELAYKYIEHALPNCPKGCRGCE